jgi:hypothetical protein
VAWSSEGGLRMSRDGGGAGGARPIPGDGIRGQQWRTRSGVKQGRWGRRHVHPAATLMAAATYSI